ncbi:hypothetical protein ACIF9R_15575 [Streptomyces sp. NPDC086080]
MAVDPLTELRDVNTYFEGPRAPRDTGPAGGGAPARPRADGAEDSPALSG